MSADARATQIIQASWLRCETQYGLDSRRALPQLRRSEGEIRQGRDVMAESMSRSGTVVHQLRELARDTGFCMLFADPDGVVVKTFSDTEDARSLTARGLGPGTVFREADVGTNGIGTSIIERRTVTVNGEEHYHPAFKPFICVSAPLIDPEGNALGALDLSGIRAGRHSEAAFLHQLLDDAALWVQSALFRHRYKDNFLVGLSQSPTIDHHMFRALIALDDCGRICGLSESALSLLGNDNRSSFLHRPIDEILGVSLGALENGSGRVQRVESGKIASGYVYSFPCETAGRQPMRPAKRVEKTPDRIKPAAATLTLDQLAGRDERMSRNIQLARRIADRNIPVLLQGETGSGKEAFARALHLSSPRRDGPFVAVNCAAIPDSLLDSELFGYEAGTFTGGLRSGKVGKVAASNHGTLFLDEIGDMRLDLQTRLLRVLSEREVTPLGGIEPVPVDIKLVCATHRDLRHMVEVGEFREDLYYRINGAKIALPPLRERADLIDLIRDIVQEESEAEQPAELSPEALACLLDYPWPGNIRQLRNVLSLAVLTRDGPRIELHDLPEEIRMGVRGKQDADMDFCSPPERLVSGLKRSLGETERERVHRALQDSKWLVTEAARQLGVSRATIHRKMKDYDLVRPDRR
jgi:transcriptional regulator of acetoin/glycerol metabolism